MNRANRSAPYHDHVRRSAAWAAPSHGLAQHTAQGGQAGAAARLFSPPATTPSATGDQQWRGGTHAKAHACLGGGGMRRAHVHLREGVA